MLGKFFDPASNWVVFIVISKFVACTGATIKFGKCQWVALLPSFHTESQDKINVKANETFGTATCDDDILCILICFGEINTALFK